MGVRANNCNSCKRKYGCKLINPYKTLYKDIESVCYNNGHFLREFNWLDVNVSCMFYNDAIDRAEIEGLPSAHPEIIRCKDCKHWREGTAFSYCDKLYGMGVLDALDYMVAEDDYCSMAERRTDE